LGKFPFRTKLLVTDYPGVPDTIIDEDNIIEGEWVGIRQKKDTVYVFSAFLSREPIAEELKIYIFNPYDKNQNGDVRTGFVNVSETYFENKNTQHSIISRYSTKDTIRIHREGKESLFRTMKLAATDTLFIYDLEQDKIHKYLVKNLPLIACVNGYVGDLSDEDWTEYEYEFGFDLGKINISTTNFAYIGLINPFQTNMITSMLWEEIGIEDFPIKFDDSIVDKDIRFWFDGSTVVNAYHFKTISYAYYVQHLAVNGIINFRHVVVLDSKTNQSIFNKVFLDSESSFLIPLNIKNTASEYIEKQWTGAIFKNKPPILYGFSGQSFGCVGISFINENEAPIQLLCDNRH